jgi:hypothetical protein
MNHQYEEVSRILGQSVSDRQVSLLSKALHEHLPSLKQKIMEDCLAKTQNDTRSDFDSERCKKEHFNALMLARNDPPDAQIQLAESRLKVKFIRHRMTDLLNRFDATKSNVAQNEIAIQDLV